MYPSSGYKSISALQLVNGLALAQTGRIRFRALRVYLACFEMLAIREAVRRSKSKSDRKGGKPLQRFTVAELAKLCELQQAHAKRELKALAREQLVVFSEGEIKVRGTEVESAGELLPLVRSPQRPVPVPRATLRFMARETRSSVCLVMLAYMIRGLGLERSGGEMRTKGSVKLVWIEALTGLSERAARYARSELIRLGWLAPDTGSKQWKLNRHGSYFEIHPDWRPPSFAPPRPKTAPPFAPPREDRKTPYGIKNQKAAGIDERKGRELPPPDFRDVQREDLYRLDRLESLYRQCVASGFIQDAEATVLNFIGAAVRAREAKGEAAKIFVAIVRRKLWGNITCAQEEVARRALNRIREVDPARFGRRGEGP